MVAITCVRQSNGEGDVATKELPPGEAGMPLGLGRQLEALLSSDVRCWWEFLRRGTLRQAMWSGDAGAVKVQNISGNTDRPNKGAGDMAQLTKVKEKSMKTHVVLEKERKGVIRVDLKFIAACFSELRVLWENPDRGDCMLGSPVGRVLRAHSEL